MHDICPYCGRRLIEMNIEKRKLWKTGKGTYITSFPVEWVVPLIEKYGDEVILSYENERILISPSKKVGGISGKIELKNSDPYLKLESEIIAAYLGNYDSLFIEIPEEKSYFSWKILELIHKLEGASIERISSNQFYITFLTPPTPIIKLLNSNFSQYKELAKQNNEVMDTFPSSDEELEEKRRIITALECEVDKRTFHIKRLLNKALFYPGYISQIEMGNVKDLLQHNLLASSLERLCDLEKELFDQETELSLQHRTTKNGIKLSNPSNAYDFQRYHQDVHDMVNFAYENRHNPNELYKLMELKYNIRSGKEYRFNNFSRERREFLIELIKKHPTYLMILTLMEQKIWGMVGIATNIAETWLNLKEI